MSQVQPEDNGAVKLNIRVELDRLEASLADLKVLYEQYFSGIIPREPEVDHKKLKLLIKKLRKAPFKNSALNYRLRVLEHRYSTFNTYWQRVLREREEGTYVRDVFKANLREKRALEDERLATPEGQTEQGVKELFQVYKRTLEKATGKAQELDFNLFRKSIMDRARAFREQHGSKKMSFRVTVKNGKVTVQAKVTE